MTTKIEADGMDIEVADPVEHVWMQAKEATERRIKNNKDALMVDEAFLEMCEQKLSEFA